MGKPLLIKRIDLLVHPFYQQPFKEIYSSNKAWQHLLKLWKEHIDEVAKDPHRILLVAPTNRAISLSEVLIKYAKRKLGIRCGMFHWRSKFYNNRGKEFDNFEEFTSANGFIIDPNKVKTRGAGEYLSGHMNNCVVFYLTKLNRCVGLKNINPYWNKQSAILPSKSIAEFGPLALEHIEKRVRRPIRRKFSQRQTKPRGPRA